MADLLRVVIRTPHALVLDEQAASVRVPTETGQVGLRPKGEPLVLAVEPGLIVLHTTHGDTFAATAGGLLESGASECTLLTPFAAIGESDKDVADALERALVTPGAELVARKRLEELEQRIVSELAQHPPAPRTGAPV